MKKQLLFIATFFVSLFISQNLYSTNYTVNTVGNTGFSPSNLTINIGDSVTFVNTGGFHNVNGMISTFPLNPQGFENPLGGVSAGWAFVHVFTIPGIYNYQCDPHIPAMVGVIIVNNSPSISSISYSNPVCFGDTNGNLTVNINQTVPPSYAEIRLFWLNPNNGNWQNSGTQFSIAQLYPTNFPFPSLYSGSYRIDVMDSLGVLIDNSVFTLYDPAELIIFMDSNSDPTTPFSNDGFIDISAIGVPPFTYDWNGPNGFSSSNEDILNLAPGNYNVTVFDSANICSSDTFFILAAIDSCDPGSISTTNVTCYLAFDGEINISNASGLYPLTYSIDTANPYLPGYIPSLLYEDTIINNSSYLFDNLIKGDYFVIFEDASGCSDTNLMSVDRSGDPFTIDSANTFVNLVSDSALFDGSFVLNLTNGGYGAPYNFIWYDSLGNVLQDSSLNTLSNLGTGSYSVVISDNGPNNCESLPFMLIMGLRQSCDADSSITHNVCPGSNQGNAKINYLNGWSDYQFYNSDSTLIGTNDSIGGLAAGFYYFHLDSSQFCPEDIINFEILEPIINDIYIVDAVRGDSVCFNDSSRISIDLSIVDPNLSYVFYIVNYATSGTQYLDSTVDYFSSGNYDLRLSYNNGTGLESCLSSPGYNAAPFIINEYDLSIDDAFTTDEICGVESAKLTIEVNPLNISNAPVSFYINGATNSTGIFNISQSIIYDSIYIEDNLGCKAYWDFPLMAEDSINTTVEENIIKESCRGNDGEINLLLDNGQGFYNYTLSKAIPFNIPMIIDSGVTSTSVLASVSIDSLVAGTYFIEISDDSSCVYLDTFLVNQVVPLTLLPLIKVKETCCGYDGSIQVNVNSGLPSGRRLTYTLEFDTIQITIDASNNVYPYTINNAVWPSQSYLTSFNMSDTSSYFDSLTGVYSYVFDSLTRGYYSIFVEDEYGCVDSADYSAFISSGNSGINTHLTIDDSYVVDMSYSYTDIVCFEDTNATIKVLYPDVCYSYELLLYSDTANPLLIAVDSISFPDTSVYYNELYAGIYGIQAMSTSGFAGCVRRSDTFQIIEPDIISYDSAWSTPAFCLNNGYAIDGGACNGTVWLPNSPIGGVYDTSAVLGDTVYQYYINRIDTTISYFQGPISTDSMFSGLCPGKYEVQVLDGNNCIIKNTVEVKNNSLYIDSFLVTKISCHDSSDATIKVYAHGGVGVYDYVWTDSSSVIVGNTQFVDGLLEGMYFVTVSDSAGCIAVGSAFVSSAPDQLKLYGRVPGFESEETCYDHSYDGHVGYEVRGGSGPYVFNWINSDSTRSGSYTAYAQYCIGCISSDGISSIDSVYILDSLTTDVYELTLTDVNGCSSINWLPIDSIRITALNINNPLSIDSINLSNSLCYGANNGFIDFFMNDSVMSPLIFELDSNLSNTNDSLINSTGFFSSLSSNTYTVLITDSFGCFIDTTYTINKLDEIVVSVSVVDLSCYESDDGEVYISFTGGLAPFTFNWNGPSGFTSNLNVIDNLSAGTYVLSIEDSNDCLAYDTVEVMPVTPLLLTIVQTNDASCNGISDASGSISVSGGTPPYQYLWSSGPSTDSTISGVPAGIYKAYIRDANGCEDTIELTFKEPLSINLEVEDISHNLCDGDSIGSISLIAYGGTANYVTYFIESTSGDIISGPSNQFDGLIEGVYMMWVEDSNGCLSIKIVDTIKEPGKIDLNLNSYNLKCFESDDGEINIIFNGGKPPYEYQLNSLDTGIVFQPLDTLVIDNLIVGFYNFDVTDYNNCKNSISVSIDQPLEVIASFTVDQNLILKGNMVMVNNLSTGASHFSWNFGDNLNISNEFELSYKYRDQGNFTIELVANNNNNLFDDCNDTTWIDVDVEGYDINNVFTPNNDGINDEYHFGDEMLVELEVAIYNRWGQQVYAFDNLNGSWDGKSFNGELMPEGVYFFIMKAVGSLGDSYVEEGSITLLR